MSRHEVEALLRSLSGSGAWVYVEGERLILDGADRVGVTEKAAVAKRTDEIAAYLGAIDAKNVEYEERDAAPDASPLAPVHAALAGLAPGCPMAAIDGHLRAAAVFIAPMDALAASLARVELVAAVRRLGVRSAAAVVGAALGMTQADESQADKTTKDTLLGLAKDAELFIALDDTTYATVAIDDHLETWPIRSRGFRRWLLALYYGKTKSAPNNHALAEALATLDAQAAHSGRRLEVFVRVAPHGGSARLPEAIYLDLADEKWRAVRITAVGWQVVPSRDVPVKFRRGAGTLALPSPERGAALHELRTFTNVADEEWPLIAGWLLGSLHPRGPYPLLQLEGEQGSGKSVTGENLRSVIDPSAAPLRAEPRETRDLMIAAEGAHVLAYDNLTRIEPWLSNALCRLSTGGAFGTRVLYSDADEILFRSKRPVILTGINGVAERSDLLDRTIRALLLPIDEKARRTEAELADAFAAAQPRILGALLDAAAAALANLPTTKLNRLPRMADFAQWVVAGEEALGLKPGQFLQAYTSNRDAADRYAVNSSPIGQPLWALLRALNHQPWQGTSQELLAALGAKATDQTKALRNWPATARGISARLREIAPNLRRLGVDVIFPEQGTRTDKAGSRIIVVRQRKTSSQAAEEDPATSSEPSEGSREHEGQHGQRTSSSDGTDSVPPTNSQPKARDISDAVAPHSNAVPPHKAERF